MESSTDLLYIEGHTHTHKEAGSLPREYEKKGFGLWGVWLRTTLILEV